MYNKYRDMVRRDWSSAVFVNRETWLSCMNYQEQVQHYSEWLDKHPDAALYLINQTIEGFCIGARYGLEGPEYLSPYGNQLMMKKVWTETAQATSLP